MSKLPLPFNSRVATEISHFVTYHFNRLKSNPNQALVRVLLSNIPLGAILTNEELDEITEHRAKQSDVQDIAREIHANILRGISTEGVRSPVRGDDS